MAGVFWIFVTALVGACSAQTSVQAESEVVVLPADGNQLNTFATLVCFITPEELNIPFRWITPDGISLERPSARYITNIGSLGSIDGSPKFGSLLIIRDISYKNAGTYLCEVMDEQNCSEFPKFAMVELVLRMTLEVASSNTTVYISSSGESSEVELRCEASGYIRPDSDLQWFKEDMEITASEKHQISFKDGQPNMAQIGRNETSPSRMFVLKINNVNMTDMGQYSCRSNDTGAMASMYLEVVKNEPTPSVSTSSHEPNLIQPTLTSCPPGITSSPANIGSSHTSNTHCTIEITVAVVCTFALTATLAVFMTIGAIYLWFKRRGLEGESSISSPNVSTFPVSPESPVDKGRVDIYQISTGDEMEESNGIMKQSSVNTAT